MAGSSLGNIITITTWGESHGCSIGVILDGIPAGLTLCESDIQKELDKRKPGQTRFSTPRKETDQVHIRSGVFEGKTTGCPISMEIMNESQNSKDYSAISEVYRPGHADYCYDCKYGIRDYRGGGRSSGRETIARVAAGAVAKKLLTQFGITIMAYAKEIGGIVSESFDEMEIQNNPFHLPDANAALKVETLVKQKMEEKDSVGGIIECIVHNVPVGLGDPVFEKLDANLAKAMFSIGAVKGMEIGDGFKAARAFGSTNNDSFLNNGNGITKKTNHSGGILGGISDGSDILLRVAIKPTPSIFQTQQTVNSMGENVEINIEGRHDPTIVPRAVVVVESMAALILADALLLNQTTKMEYSHKIYDK